MFTQLSSCAVMALGAITIAIGKMYVSPPNEHMIKWGFIILVVGILMFSFRSCANGFDKRIDRAQKTGEIDDGW